MDSRKLYDTNRVLLREVSHEASRITRSMAGRQLKPCCEAGRPEAELDSMDELEASLIEKTPAVVVNTTSELGSR